MRLKDHCELVIQLLNSPYVSQELELEDGGSISKLDIEHFVIVHSSDTSKWEEENRKKRIANATRRRRAVYDNAAAEEPSDGLGEGEEKVSISKEDELHLIRKLRKVACGSTTTLADNGWFICPVYVGMESLNPIVSHKLPNKKGYRLTVLSTPIATFSKKAFTRANLKEWELNSIPTFNRILPVGLQAMSVFVHRRDDLATRTIRNAVNRLETTQRTRIKLGNILIDEVRTHVGQEAYVSNKESLAQTAKGRQGDSSTITQYDVDEVKTIRLIEDAYTKVNSVAIELGIKEAPIHRKLDFVKAMERLKAIEEEEHEARAVEQYHQWLDDDEAYLAWYTSTSKRTGLTLSDVPSMESARLATSTLTSFDYIPSYVTYLNTKGYMEMKRIEADAKTVVHELVHTSWLWPYIEGIKGCGEVTTAYILADIDFRSTVHPSSVLRYLGLDNVTDVPKRDEADKPTDGDLERIFQFLFHNYESIVGRENGGKLPPLNEASFYQYATDMVSTWEEFLSVRFVYSYMGRDGKGLSYRDVYEAPISDGFSELVDKVWRSVDVVEYVNEHGDPVLTIKKRARGKQDASLSTYLTSDGKVATKRSLGYNAKLKARILEVMFDSMTKAKNPYYYGEVYLNHKRRLEEKYRSMGVDPSSMKMRIHRMARRVAVQVFIEELWMHARAVLGYPLNGGTYYEAKLKGSHGHGSSCK